MQRCLTTALTALFLLFLGLATPPLLEAQGWNSPRVRALVERATERRAAQLADPGLQTYKAEARGYLTFLAQLGEGFREPPKVIKTDQIASDIYWRAPNFSKQYIKGRRDTLLLPTNINYHRDHLGIVQNNFPEIIRLGDGDEVEDVPHPLSATGLQEYDFAIRDSLQIRLGPKTLDVYEVRVRPKNDQAPRAIGSVYIDRESAEVVRMTLSFTRVALKDQSLEDVTVVLENGLIEGRFWLPRQQSIEIRRTGKWLDYPARGIIRGRWEISNYEVNVDLPPYANYGPEILAAPGSKVDRNGNVTNPTFQFEGGILDSLPPDVTAASDHDILKVQEEARELVRAQALARSSNLALYGRRVSDFIRVNRVEGFALGLGAARRLGAGFAMSAGTSYGFSDREWKARGSIEYVRASGARVAVSGYRMLHDVSIVPERSGVINTFASQEFGSDYTNLYFVRGASISMSTSTLRSVRGLLEFAYERHDSAGLHAKPASGRYESVIQFPAFREMRLTVGADVRTRLVFGGTSMAASARISGIRGRAAAGGAEYEQWLRPVVTLQLEKEFGTYRLLSQSVAAGIIGSSTPPLQHLIYLGGPVSAPGYDFHSLVGRAGVSQRVEWQFKVPFVAVPLGTWGRAPASLTLAPYANAAWINGLGWKPSVGVGALTIFELLRFDIARGLRDGRWSFGFDVSRAFWGVL
jgi:hypothetical protein